MTGLIALRWPENWSGHVLSPEVAEPIVEGAFQLLWGEPLEDARPPGRTIRLPQPPNASAWVGPVPDRRSMRQSVRLTAESGRLDVQIDAELDDLAGRSFEIGARLPEALRLVRVEADGLTTWSRPTPDRLSLRFDGRATSRRLIQIRGWLPAIGDPMAVETTRREVPVPWPIWSESDEEPGTLTLITPSSPLSTRASPGAAPRPPELVPATGVVAISTPANEPAGSTGGAASSRLTYRVDRPEELGTLRWAIEPAWVFVSVHALMTVYPTSAEWIASIRYQVEHGPCDALFLRVPTAWTEDAEVELVGMGHQLTSRPEGETTSWTIRPDRPLWGAHRVIIRSSRPVRRGEPIDFPALVPKGRGAAETSVMVADASGLRLIPEGSPGLQPIEAARLGSDAPIPPIGLPLTAYRVRRDDWTLRVRTPGSFDAASEPRGEFEEGENWARVTLADLLCVLAPDGSAWARLDTTSRPSLVPSCRSCCRMGPRRSAPPSMASPPSPCTGRWGAG